MDFKNKVILITGASSGIGAECALKFAKLSAKLSLVGRNEENLHKIASKCEEINNTKPVVIVGDISKDEDVEKIVDQTIKHHGVVDVLINNAGISKPTTTRNGIEVFDRIMATNLRGTYLLTSKCIPYLLKSKGNIIMISSILSAKPSADLAPYCMSKAALDMFTQCLALELGPKGVRVNTINPGTVNTEIYKTSLGFSEKRNDEYFKSLEAKTPLRKVPTAEGIAELAAFLASDKANCITGTSHVIDCGFSLLSSFNI